MVGLFVISLVLALSIYAFSRLSPWASALRVRRAFDKDGLAVNDRLARHVPSRVLSHKNEQYDELDRDAFLDIYYPDSDETDEGLPTIVWVHGGGWIAGSKEQIENYARILAARGFSVVALDYSLAPAKKYPTPVRQLTEALRYLQRNASQLHVDPTKIFLAGDSAGAQIAAQVANLIRSPSYADRLGVSSPIHPGALAGVLLFCGRYDLKTPPFGGLVTTMLWAYSGTKRFMDDPDFQTFSVLHSVTSDFPPTFITSGNGDSLNPQSIAFSEALSGAGVFVDSLFFPEDYSPSLPHEYQFHLDTDAGRLALERALAFLSRFAGREVPGRDPLGGVDSAPEGPGVGFRKGE